PLGDVFELNHAHLGSVASFRIVGQCLGICRLLEVALSLILPQKCPDSIQCQRLPMSVISLPPLVPGSLRIGSNGTLLSTLEENIAQTNTGPSRRPGDSGMLSTFNASYRRPACARTIW